MSRGLGRRQTLILRALVQLEREDGAGRFLVWSVLEMAWSLALRQEEAARWTASGMAGAVRRSDNVRQRRPDGSHLVEGVNPSRCLAMLARRGLVERKGRRGPGAAVGLTEAGRLEARSLHGQSAGAADRPAEEAA